MSLGIDVLCFGTLLASVFMFVRDCFCKGAGLYDDASDIHFIYVYRNFYRPSPPPSSRIRSRSTHVFLEVAWLTFGFLLVPLWLLLIPF